MGLCRNIKIVGFMNTNKNIFLIVLISLVILMIVPGISAEATNNEHQNAGNVIDIPEQSRIVDLGNGMMRYDHVHRDNSAKPDKPDNPNKPDKAPSSSPFDYKLMGASWPEPARFVINPTFPGGLAFADTGEVISASLSTWNYAGEDERSYDIFCDVLELNLTIVRVSGDSSNTVTFEDLGDTGIIAQAQTWYWPGGDIVESDVVFSTRYTWSLSGEGEAGKMDLQNIATHELGHSAGLLDLYHWKSSENTMYGYSDYGETKKQSLEPGDIAGINAIYGE